MGILLVSPKAANDYRYFGTRSGRLLRATVRLDSATTTDGHVAVWLGASTWETSAWVQGGVAYAGGQPFVYIEFKRRHHSPLLTGWPATFGQTVSVRLECHSARWRVLIDGHLSRGIYMPRVARFTTLELYGDASGSGVINGKEVHG